VTTREIREESAVMERAIGVVARERDTSIAFPPFRLCPVERKLWRGDRAIALKPKTFSILQYLVQRPRRMVEREELLAEFWPDVHVGDGVLKTHICEIRQALGDSAREPRFIETAHRQGYRFVGSLRLGEANVPSSGRMSASKAGVETLFVGRKPEVRALMAEWASALAGARRVVFVIGEAGIGKTALLRAWREQVTVNSDALVMWGQCVDQYGAGEPYLPIVEALRRDANEPRRALIAECVRHHAPAWLAAMGSIDTRPPASDAMPAHGSPDATLRQVAETLEALARERAVALLLEDLHWADPSTVDLLAYLAQRSDPARLLVVGTYRPHEHGAERLCEIVEVLEARRQCLQLAVPQLTPEAVGAYLAHQCDQPAVPAALTDVLHRRTEGNPLFMVGVVNGWMERGLLGTGERGCDIGASLEQLASCVPDTFRRMVQRELSRLDALRRSVLEAASVVGHEFSIPAVAAALTEDPFQVEEVCLAWARHGLFLRRKAAQQLSDGSCVERCEFVHSLYQQVTYEHIGAARRREWHLRIGRWLEAAHGDEVRHIASELALHFGRSGDISRTIHYLRLSGENALRRGAHREAIEHLTRALSLVKGRSETPDTLRTELDLCVLLAPALRNIRGYAAPEVEYAYARTAELCERLGAKAQLFATMAGRGALYVLRGESDSAVPIGERLLQLAEDAGDSSVAIEAHVVIGIGLHHLGRHREAQSHLEQVTAFYGSEQMTRANLTSLDHGFGARSFFASSSLLLGHLDRARSEAEATLIAARESGNPLGVAYALDAISYLHLWRREPELAQPHIDALIDVCEKNGFNMFAAFAILHLGEAQSQRGELVAAVETLAQGKEMLQATGARAYDKCWASWLANAYLNLGNAGRALEVIEQAASHQHAGGERAFDSELLRIRGEILLQIGRGKDSPGGTLIGVSKSSLSAEECFSNAIKTARQQNARLFELRAAMSLTRYWQRQGRQQQTRFPLADIYAWFSEGLDTPDLREARALLANARQG
jgi:DNA-binding winged helix-turn-helix (wHTH) protein/tetratricopeptide (TPR) repeat protein